MTGLILGQRFFDALVWAAELHADQWRKGTAVPYLSHLLAVASLVLEDGGSEDEAIAALLHDAVEDQPDRASVSLIQESFGVRVAEIVDACTDADEHPKPPWRGRKERYIAHLAETGDDGALRVALADKLQNGRAILRDYRVVGPTLWERFNVGADEQLWYYEELVGVFARRRPGPMAEELAAVVAELERLTRAKRAT